MGTLNSDEKRGLEPFWVALKEVEHPFGTLCVGEQGHHFPFPVSRVYFVHAIPEEAVRGGHAHRENQEVVFCVQGACTLWLFAPDGKQHRFRLETPTRGVFVPPLWWVELGEYSPSAMTLVVASLPFRESDYIREAEAFFHAQPFPDPVSRPRD